MPPKNSPPRHKDLTWQQLRSFCEAGRLGSLSAAAQSLGLAQPTVWAQVHALERQFGRQLLVTHAKGCKLTAEGMLLAELAAPSVTGISRLKDVFDAKLTAQTPRIQLATTPRTMLEELPECLVAFEKKHPEVELRIQELPNAQIVPNIVAGRFEIGLTTWIPNDESAQWIQQIACYQLPTLLVIPKKHLLFKRKLIEPKDIEGFPVINSPDNVSGDPAAHAAIMTTGNFGIPGRKISAFYVASIRRYVELGFGLGLISALPARPSPAGYREVDLSEHFGRTTVFAIARSDTIITGPLADFVENLKQVMQRRIALSAASAKLP